MDNANNTRGAGDAYPAFALKTYNSEGRSVMALVVRYSQDEHDWAVLDYIEIQHVGPGWTP